MIRSHSVALVLVLLSGTLCCSARAAGDSADETAAIRKTSDEFVAAFNQGNAQAVADLWATDGELVDAAGRTHQGRTAIATAYAEFFKSHPHEQIEVAIDSIRLLNSDAAIETGRASLTAGNSASANYSAVHVKQDGKWLMAVVYETSADSEVVPENLSDLEWLVGEWTGEEYGARTDIVCRALLGKKFLQRKYKVTAADGQVTTGMQLIGIHPRTGKIVSWGFESDGGLTHATWLPRPDGWAIDAIGLLASGAETHAVNLLTKLDDNAYSWQSVRRSVDGEPRPDTDEVILKRVVEPTPKKL